ncbi:MAG: ABC transporter permease [Anaerolineae bacterium]|nr:ABC transporter permease [Anaerolineae bacterium]
MVARATYSNRMTGQRATRRFWNLLWALSVRDIRSRYRRSFLGPLWAVVQPLMMMVVFTALRGVLSIDTDIPYPIFSYSALVPWTYFSSVVNSVGPSILSNKSIMQKINLPPELFPLVGTVTAGFDMLMAALVLGGLMFFYHIPLTIHVLWIPLLVLMMSVLGLSVGMFFSALGVYRRDFLQVSSFLVRLWLYATPIIYPISEVPEQWRTLYALNPMVGILEGFRSVVARGETPDLDLLLMAVPGTILALVVAWPLYRFMARYFADVL